MVLVIARENELTFRASAPSSVQHAWGDAVNARN